LLVLGLAWGGWWALTHLRATSECLIGDNFPISQAPGQHESPAIAYNSKSNEYLVVWQNKESPLANWNICARVVSSIGNVPDDPGFCVAEPGDKQFPAVVYNNTDNNYLVAWQDARDLGSLGWDIYVQLISGVGKSENGSRPFTEIRLRSGGDQGSPAIAYNGTDNEYLVVWQDRWCIVSPPPVTADDIYGRTVSNTGNPKGDIIPISVATDCKSQDGQQNAAIAYNSEDNQYFVVWQDSRNGNWDIYGQFLSTTGDLIGGTFPIIEILADQQFPDIAYNSQDNVYLVVWQDNRYGDWAIHGRRVSRAGQLYGDFLISRSQGSERIPAIAYDSKDNEYLVVWQDGRGEDEDVYGRRVSNEDELLAGECPISVLANDQEVPDVAYNGQSNEYLVVWQDERNGEDNDDIYGQRVSPAPPTQTRIPPYGGSPTPEQPTQTPTHTPKPLTSTPRPTYAPTFTLTPLMPTLIPLIPTQVR